MSKKPVNIAIFASGNGSNAENIVRYFKDNARINPCLILTNKADAYVLERAKNLNIASGVFTAAELKEGSRIRRWMRDYDIDFIVLAGFLLKIPDYLIQLYPNKIINIHPALLPKFGGKGMYGSRVHEAVKAAEETETGISIHFVNEHYDEGQIIFQQKVKLSKEDTPDSIAEKVHALEYEYFPKVIEEILS
jgi:phosphoribosylglycinamide formyltransferase-1